MAERCAGLYQSVLFESCTVLNRCFAFGLHEFDPRAEQRFHRQGNLSEFVRVMGGNDDGFHEVDTANVAAWISVRRAVPLVANVRSASSSVLSNGAPSAVP